MAMAIIVVYAIWNATLIQLACFEPVTITITLFIATSNIIVNDISGVINYVLIILHMLVMMNVYVWCSLIKDWLLIFYCWFYG